MGKLSDLIRAVENKAYDLSMTMYHMRVYGGLGKCEDSAFIRIFQDKNPKGYGMQALNAQENLIEAQSALVNALEKVIANKRS